MHMSNCMCSLAAVSTSDTRNQGHNVDLRFSTARLMKGRVGYCSSCTQITMALHAARIKQSIPRNLQQQRPCTKSCDYA
jgi:hypothetical protein